MNPSYATKPCFNMAAARGNLVGRLAIVTGKLLFFDAKRRGEDFSQGLHDYFFFHQDNF